MAILSVLTIIGLLLIIKDGIDTFTQAFKHRYYDMPPPPFIPTNHRRNKR